MRAVARDNHIYFLVTLIDRWRRRAAFFDEMLA